MGYSKKQYEELINNAEAIVLLDEYGEPKVMPKSWYLEGFFDGYNLYRKKKKDE